MWCRTVLCSAIVVAACGGCDRTPSEIDALATAKLPQVRAFAKTAQSSCVNAGPMATVSDWGGLDKDAAVLNVQVTCKTVRGLGLATAMDPLRPAPPGDKSGTPHRVGVSKGKSHEEEPFPLEEVTKPSWLTSQPNTVDLCVRSGHPDDPDYTQVCVAYALPSE